MIRICKGNDIQVVTKGAYESLYKPLGYKPVLEEQPKKVEKSNEEIKVQLEDKYVRPQRRSRGSSSKTNKEEE